MHKLSIWTASVVLGCGLASCGESVDTSSASGAGGSGGDATSSGSSTAGSSGTKAAGSGGMGSGGSMAGAGGGSCMPITTDSTAIGEDCEASMQCPTGYTCQPFHGILIQYKCEILCTQSCECPDGIQCVATSDKGGTWMQCGP